MVKSKAEMKLDETENYKVGLDGARDKKLLYHLTKVDNMETIINYGLMPRKYLVGTGCVFWRCC
jgi:hypothetical protein